MGRKNRMTLWVLTIVLALLPVLVRNPYYLGVLVFVGIYSLITIGLSMLMGYAGQISLGHAGFFAIGAYTSGLLTTKGGVPPIFAFFAAMLLTACVAFLIGVPSLRLRGHYLAMATLGFGEIVHIALNASVDLTGGPSGFGEIPRIALGGLLVESALSRYYLVYALVITALLLSLNIVHSRVGRALRSIHGSEVAASAMGVNTARYKVQVFVLSAVYASVAGSLYAHFITFISPGSFDLTFSVLLVTMVVIGGMSSVWGALMGTVLLGLLPEVLRGFKDYDILIYGAILLLMMMFMPEGLFGLTQRVFVRRGARS
ncbi:MAG: branched-chain amino acid ABC transporter permease [Candidatus Latescibacteria bacterium]|nr:branched-chain amino acid ABC transporter permease [Candidatus Latescibacterota bacterium]MCK5734754.1 branched-chain amino acid ABC transporter permease [Candidatus Latescibacterota bacterium]